MKRAGVTGPRTLGLFALLGAMSGAAATVIVHSVQFDASLTLLGLNLELSPVSLVPGLCFGLTIGAALHPIQRIGVPRYSAYVVASTASNLAAVTLAFEIHEITSDSLRTGFIAGLFGSACLTGLSALLFRFVRRRFPCLLMLASGCLLGGLLAYPLESGDGFWRWLVFFASWQAGYAASLATALPWPRAGAPA